MANSLSALQKLQLHAKQVYDDFSSYKKTAIIVALLSLWIVSSFFTWPSVLLLQYAFGATTGLTAAQLSLLATQYVSAFSFWGHLAFGSAVTLFVPYFLSQVCIFTARILHFTVNFTSFDLKYLRNISTAEDSPKDSPECLSDTSALVDSLFSSPERVVMNLKLNNPLTPEIIMQALLGEAVKNKLEEFSRNSSSDEDSLNNQSKKFSKYFSDEFCIKFYTSGFNKFATPLLANMSDSTKKRLSDYVEADLRARYVPVVSPVFQPIVADVAKQFFTDHVGVFIVKETFLNNKKTPYSVLDIDSKASTDQVRKAYYSKCLEHHPDSHTNSTNEVKAASEADFKIINDAYKLLMDPLLRKNTDRVIQEAGIQIDLPDTRKKLLGVLSPPTLLLQYATVAEQEAASKAPTAPSANTLSGMPRLKPSL